ncbi:DUF2029 domain-containing protein [bacterium]|nr:DUF2029 domain-containing protein [bacterium]
MSNARNNPERKFVWLVAALLALSFAEAFMLAASGAVHSNDFKHLWAGAWLLAHGRNAYDPAMLFNVALAEGWTQTIDGKIVPVINPFVYLPTTGLMLWPLAAMPFVLARAWWFWINWALAWAVVIAGPKMLGVKRPWAASFAAGCLITASMPMMRQMTAGQMNVATAALIVAAAWAFRRRREGALGGLLAVGFGWKIAPALLIAALLPMRRWKAFAWAIAASIALALISLLAYGTQVNADALAMTRQMGYGHSTWETFGRQFHLDAFNMAPGALMIHAFAANPVTRPWIDLGMPWAIRLTMLASLMLIAAWLIPAWRAGKNATASMPLFLAASLLMLLLPSLMWDHYAVQALPALMLIFGDERTWKRPARAISALVIFGLLACPIQHDAGAFRSGPGILVMSLRLWPILAMYFWLTCEAYLPPRRPPR